MLTRSDHPDLFSHVAHLPEHSRVLEAVLGYFMQRPEIQAGFFSGSLVTGGMDPHSDLDLGFLCRDEDARSKLWKDRWNWPITEWFHRFDADHIKPYFVIYFFEPDIHVDLCFYIESDLPSSAGAPYRVAWDEAGRLRHWFESVNGAPADALDWSNVIHEDERIWAWIHYCLAHILRGEYYDAAVFFPFLRGIVEQWQARLAGQASFDTRRLEARIDAALLADLSQLFPAPNRVSLKQSFQTLIRIAEQQRQQITSLTHPTWTVTESTRLRLSGTVAGL